MKNLSRLGHGKFKTLILGDEIHPLIPTKKHIITVNCPVEERKELIRRSPQDNVSRVKKLFNKSESSQCTMKNTLEVVQVNSLS